MTVFSLRKRAGRNPQGVSRAAEKWQTGASACRLSILVYRSIVTWLRGMISCRNCLEFLAGYVLGDGRFQCGKDDAGGLLDDFQ